MRQEGWAPTQGLGPYEIREFLKRRRWTMVAGVATTMVLFGAAAFVLPPRYESTASFLVAQEPQGGGSEVLALLDRLGQARNTETEVELIQSRRVVEPVVELLDLHVRMLEPDPRVRPGDAFLAFQASRDAKPGKYRIQPDSGEYVISNDETGEPLVRGSRTSRFSVAGLELTLPAVEDSSGSVINVLPFAEAVEATQSRFTAEPTGQQTDVVELTCSGPTPEQAQELCAQIQNTYLLLRSELQRAEASATAAFLDDQVARISEELTVVEDSLQRYQEENQAVALQEVASQGVIQYATVRARHRELAAERNALSSLIDGILTGGGGRSEYRRLASFPTFLQSNDHIVSRLVENLVEMENRQSDLAVRRNDVDPELGAVNARIEQIEDQLLDIAQSYEQSLSAQINSLDATIEEQARDLTAVPEHQVESARLERRVVMLADLYRYLQTRLQEAEVAQAVTLPSVRVIDPASLPFEPASPNLPINLALGLILGLGVGFVAALWREHTDESVRDWKELDQLDLPVLSMVPRVRKKGFWGLRRRRARALLPGRASADTTEVAGEAFRTLAFEIEAAGRRLARGDLRSVAVTSAGPGEGKTFCSPNLAVQTTLLGMKTLLIDADMRAQGVGRWLNVKSGAVGLGDLVRNDHDPEAAVTRVDLGNGMHLNVMPSGQEHSASPRLITASLRRIVKEAATRYDLVIVDTPPLNVLSDAAQVASAVDAVILVVRSGVTQRPALEFAMERLDRAGAHVLGIALNEVDLPDYYTSYNMAQGAKSWTLS